MIFHLRLAKEADLPAMMEIMREVKQNLSQSDWFVEDDDASVLSVLQGKGFAVIAETDRADMAGFFIVKVPAAEENLGRYLGYSRERLNQVLLMDSAAVRPCYRGYGLQQKMLAAAENHITGKKPYDLLCTVHPDNRYSLSNMEAAGYRIRASVSCYGGLPRYILEKQYR